MGLRYRNLRGFEMGLAERREEAARPVETRVLPREVLEAQIRKVGWLSGRWSFKCGVVEERCLMWRGGVVGGGGGGGEQRGRIEST